DRGRNGVPLEERIDVIGVALDRDLGWGNFAFPLRFGGAVDGGAGGYMEVLTGITWWSGGVVAIEAAALGGIAGGGNVDTGGGGLLRSELGIGVKPWRSLSLGLRGGWMWGLEGDFDGASAVMEVAWDSVEWSLIDGDRGTLAREAVHLDPWRI